jgi:hypothetical protein
MALRPRWLASNTNNFCSTAEKPENLTRKSERELRALLQRVQMVDSRLAAFVPAAKETVAQRWRGQADLRS